MPRKGAGARFLSLHGLRRPHVCSGSVELRDTVEKIVDAATPPADSSAADFHGLNAILSDWRTPVRSRSMQMSLPRISHTITLPSGRDYLRVWHFKDNQFHDDAKNLSEIVAHRYTIG